MDGASSWLVFFPLTVAVIVMVLIHPHKPEPRAKARPRWQRFTLLPLLRDRFPPLVGRSIPHSGTHELIGWILVAILMAVAFGFAVD